MSETKHTPTPWRVADEGNTSLLGNSIGTSILNAAGYAIAETNANAVLHDWYKKPGAEHWATDSGGYIDLPEGEAEANAAFIVRAANSHQELVEALESARREIAFFLRGNQVLIESNAAVARIDAALSRARGEAS